MSLKTPRKAASNNQFGTPKTGLPTLVSPPVSSRLRSRNRKSVQTEESESLTPLAKKRTFSTPSKTQPVKRVSEEITSLKKTPKTATRRRTKSVLTEQKVTESSNSKEDTTEEQPNTPSFASPPLIKRLRSSKKSDLKKATPVTPKGAETPQGNLAETPTPSRVKNSKGSQSVNRQDNNVAETNESGSESESESVNENSEKMENEQEQETNSESEEEQTKSASESEEEEEQQEELATEDAESSEKLNEEPADEESDSDDDAPEAVSLSSSKSMALQAKKQEREAAQKIADQQRQKRREIDSKLKEQKAAKKDRVAKQALPLIEIEEEEAPKPLEIPTTLPLEMLEMVADMDEELPKKRNHIKMDEFESLSDDEPQVKKVKGEKTFGGIKVVSLTSQPKAKPVPESITDFKSQHFFGNRVNRKSSVLNMSQRRNVAVKFRRL